MIFLLSPAKSLDWQTPIAPDVLALATPPQFMQNAAQLVGLLRKQSGAQIGALMKLSPALAELNWARYRDWSPDASVCKSRPAALAFAGDVYVGLQAMTLQPADLRWAQQRVAILSGLYGVLHPLDWLQPYRLEMGTRLSNPHGQDLYAYWGSALAEYVSKQALVSASAVVVNLASKEYFRAVNNSALRPRVVECVFEDWTHTGYKVISFFAKRARGLMVRYAIENRISAPAELKKFQADGYAYDDDASEAKRLVFRRR
jgi:uncharacterized protein